MALRISDRRNAGQKGYPKSSNCSAFFSNILIDPHDKSTDDTEILIARAAIAEAQRVFILGYGFDEHNSGRLNLREYLRYMTELRERRVAFTNFLDVNQINKRASNLFYGSRGAFPPGGAAIVDRYEKSTRNTYDALALDFDLAD